MSNSDPSTPVTSKKRRIEDGLSEPAVTRSTQFWFEDGTIIIQAETTQFRVYRGLLSRHSTFFSSMFKVPQPQGETLVEGCSVIVVADRAQDWRCLLEVIHDVRDFRSQSSSQSKSYPVPTLISMLRLGHKYQFDGIRSIAVQGLNPMFPKKLISWDMMEHTAKSRPAGKKKTGAGYEFELINVLLETGLETALPSAYMICLRDQGLKNIFRGIILPDGTFSSLSPAIQATLALARERIVVNALKYCIARPLKLFDPDKCRHPSRCSMQRAEATTRRTAQIFVNFADTGQLDKGFCSYCEKTIAENTSQGRETLWEKLPSMFDLPDWGIMKDTDA